MNRLIKSALLAAALLSLLPGQTARAQSFDDTTVEGVLFFQERASSDPKTTAWPIEYRSVASNEKIILVMTREGKKLRLLATQVPMILPYPGRGGLDRDQAIMLCDAALASYPQHARLIGNVRKAWTKVTPADYVKHAAQSAARQSLLSSLLDAIAVDANADKSRLANTPRKPSPPSKLGTPPPAPPSGSTTAVAATKSADSPSAPGDIQKSLEIIKEYYKASEELGQ